MKFYAMTQRQCCYCDLHRSRSREYCPLVSDFRDAAEFEARVAAKLTGLNAAELPCYPNFLCLFSAKHLGMGCKDCFLKHARLAVEAEMEKEGK